MPSGVRLAKFWKAAPDVGLVGVESSQPEAMIANAHSAATMVVLISHLANPVSAGETVGMSIS